MNVHRSRALGVSLGVITVVMASGCLTLTTAGQENSGGSGGMSPSSSSGGGLSGNECATVQDCPSTTTCKTMACTNSHCASGFDPAGAICSGDQVCDGNGSCVECVKDGDCFGATASCEKNQCISCKDGQKNGEETDVDCGGSKCSPCPAMMCLDASDCATGNCVDGVCCDTPCTELCKACNLVNKVGKCSSLPSGTEDPGVCETTKACSGFTASCKLKNGQPCMNDNECVSDDCSPSNVCEF